MTDPKLTLTINIVIVCTMLVALSHVGWLFPAPVFELATPVS